ncbi:Undecaprenyl-diphosphatase [Gemmata obscuriglobus]|uniref:Undecaprenyl-diphosphatase n=1 Tax=Gemmata obscuriglobus TaxID=114 RepID=A0A2Z3HC21_9BACT|nr:undecaprenyl-diphosphatase UppP [Gemmata obscuriglobus]AWM41286.1 undecaprenyl-diphosphatase UppP [Gemmata obscuriglobus]QEG25366.1 Undecaprenyl-diphosphatase [Gemmata obscuriglobus]VTR98360.1 udp pyrophosphate phosphatase : Undecaprenyl-diphosphatase OS=Chlorobium phaeobacteroides (strain BS1) GN=uppP PE=3 SV=1: BacA [Gemmata obscuriglobus UQM 2246]
MPIWEAVLLGIIQGLTEFLPISSTAHLLVARNLLGHEKPEDAFTVVIQLGTLVAVFVYFRSDIAKMLRGLVADVRARRLASTPESRLGWFIVLGSVPVVGAGFTLKKWLKVTFFNPTSIAIVAIAFALLMALSEWWAARRAGRGQPPRAETEITWFDALWIGAFQALALMPGGSRSGTTITAGLFAGLSRSAAARFSFLLSLPAILGAGLKEMYDERATLLASEQLRALVVGLLVSALVGYFAIAFLLSFLKRYSTSAFVVYRLLLGVGILGLIAVGVLK